MKTFKDLMIQETLDAMQENKDSIFDNPFRLGSEMFFQTIHEARRLHLEGKYRPTAVDKNLLKTDLGEFAEFDGQHVPLDCPTPKDKKLIKKNISLEPLEVMLSYNELISLKQNDK